jgi:hypothetical protein
MFKGPVGQQVRLFVERGNDENPRQDNREHSKGVNFHVVSKTGPILIPDEGHRCHLFHEGNAEPVPRVA